MKGLKVTESHSTPKKENIQHVRTWIFVAFFFLGNFFLACWIRIPDTLNLNTPTIASNGIRYCLIYIAMPVFVPYDLEIFILNLILILFLFLRSTAPHYFLVIYVSQNISFLFADVGWGRTVNSQFPKYLAVYSGLCIVRTKCVFYCCYLYI